ncbi:gpW family head-tail joining protein [Nitrospirillum sp. BR 11163]|uniref:gpW family head-tail joining protein n=1 Tax=Nitrospirillum sp. BR 11163 TaxID=3104323 RepID=UPI002AFE0EBE|nr:gpW family head-tail joining protein [Nitrospirillum sp. BR 11163]MEA1674089.1 gpW family head-tail joining protein [Nitrospirillum sp. BR 11163]
MTTDPDTLRRQLCEAEAALHKATMGASLEEVRDGSGRVARYTPADITALRIHIAELKAKLGIGGRAGPMRPMFSR